MNTISAIIDNADITSPDTLYYANMNEKDYSLLLKKTREASLLVHLISQAKEHDRDLSIELLKHLVTKHEDISVRKAIFRYCHGNAELSRDIVAEFLPKTLNTLFAVKSKDQRRLQDDEWHFILVMLRMFKGIIKPFIDKIISVSFYTAFGIDDVKCCRSQLMCFAIASVQKRDFEDFTKKLIGSGHWLLDKMFDKEDIEEDTKLIKRPNYPEFDFVNLQTDNYIEASQVYSRWLINCLKISALALGCDFGVVKFPLKEMLHLLHRISLFCHNNSSVCEYGFVVKNSAVSERLSFTYAVCFPLVLIQSLNLLGSLLATAGSRAMRYRGMISKILERLLSHQEKSSLFVSNMLKVLKECQQAGIQLHCVQNVYEFVMFLLVPVKVGFEPKKESSKGGRKGKGKVKMAVSEGDSFGKLPYSDEGIIIGALDLIMLFPMTILYFKDHSFLNLLQTVISHLVSYETGKQKLSRKLASKYYECIVSLALKMKSEASGTMYMIVQLLSKGANNGFDICQTGLLHMNKIMHPSVVPMHYKAGFAKAEDREEEEEELDDQEEDEGVMQEEITEPVTEAIESNVVSMDVVQEHTEHVTKRIKLDIKEVKEPVKTIIESEIQLEEYQNFNDIELVDADPDE